MLKRTLAGLVVAVVTASGAVAGPLEDGVAAFNRGDYTIALQLLRPLAQQGNAKAETNLGWMYD
jgi:TPR repeat protein